MLPLIRQHKHPVLHKKLICVIFICHKTTVIGKIRKHLLAARPTVDEKKDGKEKGKLFYQSCRHQMSIQQADDGRVCRTSSLSACYQSCDMLATNASRATKIKINK